jgi:ribose transport system substrate-binding protein
MQKRSFNFRRIWQRRAILGIVVAAALSSTALVLSTGASAKTAHPASSNIVIGFSQSYTGNAFRKDLDVAFNKQAAELEKQGVIKGTDLLVSNNNNSLQISQIEDLIVKHVSVIIIDPNSATALNGAIADAYKAGIPVLVINDGPVTSTLPYELTWNNNAIYSLLAQYIVKQLHGKGNVLNVRGIAGSKQDQNVNDAFEGVVKKYPGIHVVGQVYGNWTQSVAETAIAGILPTLPTVNAIFDQGAGEEYGAVQAYEAAGKKLPLIVGGNSGAFIQWWIKEHKLNGYTTISNCGNPGIGGVATYVATQIALKKHVPKDMQMQGLVIDQANLNQFANTPVNGQAFSMYSVPWIKSHVLNQ